MSIVILPFGLAVYARRRRLDGVLGVQRELGCNRAGALVRFDTTGDFSQA